MPTSKDPESRLDRVARDLSRTLLHGARPQDISAHIRPATVLTGQQIPVDLPLGDLDFSFSAGSSTSRVTIDHAQAAATDQFMRAAVGADGAQYLSLNIDRTVPTWIFQQRQFSLTNPPPLAESLSTATLTVAELPSTVLREVENTAGDSYVSLLAVDRISQTSTVIPASSWQPAVLLRFPLVKIDRPDGVPDGTQVYELRGTPEGDRWFLDQLGLLPGLPIENPPTVNGITMALEMKDSQGNLVHSPVLTEWSLARTNLSREARPGRIREFAITATPPPLPYIVLSGDPGQNEDALRLLEMASITNSGGYFVSCATDWPNADSLILAATLTPKPDPNTSSIESAWMPPAANAVALASALNADVVRFNGHDHIEISPASPPGTVSFGWTRTLPTDPPSPEDKFGYGTLSIVDYSATDGSGQPVPMADAIPIISPMQALSGDHYPAMAAPPTAPGDSSFQIEADNRPIAAMRLASFRRLRAVANYSDKSETQYYRGTLVCYDKKSAESPWQRLIDSKRRQVFVKPGFRDVFGNRFDAVSAPIYACRLFYTDAIISPADWPGLRFGLYPEMRAGAPSLTLELLYDYKGFDDKRAKRLRDIRDQLRGVAGDVTVSLLADPLVGGPQQVPVQPIADQLDRWASGATQSVMALGSFTCNGPVVDVTPFDPRIRIMRKTDYLPSSAELPSDQHLGDLILAQITSATVSIALQIDSAPPVPTPPGPGERRDDFPQIAQRLQSVVAAPLGLQVGFLRDQLNLHELWLIPNAFFPSAPSDDASANWFFSTPCPLRNTLGNESFPTPDFTRTTATDPMWGKYGIPLKDLAVVDQDLDELGRLAFRLLEDETANLGSLMPRANAVPMRSLLQSREEIATQLGTFNGDGSGPGFIVPLLSRVMPGDLDPAAASRIATDAFLGDLSSFYAVSTLIQLPLSRAGDKRIQTFQGTVTIPTVPGPGSVLPTFSDVLLGGGDPKVTVLYELPPKVTGPVPPPASLTVTIGHVQRPLPGAPPGASPFNEGPWIELAAPFALTWKGFSQPIPVADRVFPSKPIIRSTEALMPTLSARNPGGGPTTINAGSAALLSKWGWRFSFSLVNAAPEDTVHVTVRYPQYQPSVRVLRAATLSSDWSPASLLQGLMALKSLRDNWSSTAVAGKRIGMLDDLAQSMLHYLSEGPRPDTQLIRASAIQDQFDVFTIDFGASGISNDSRQVMTGPITVEWAPPSTGLTRIDTATLQALAEASGNNACLTGSSPARGYELSLTLTRNETFLNQPANRLLVYRCAPVESPLDCRPLNLWDWLTFDMAGHSFESALQTFFQGIFQGADLTRLSMEAGASLVWRRGWMDAITPFSILPADIKPGAGTVKDIVTFISQKCAALLGGSILQPPQTDSASIRLRVKITASDKDTPSGSRTLLDAPATDFPLRATQIWSPSMSNDNIPKQPTHDLVTSSVEGEFARPLLDVMREMLRPINAREPGGGLAIFPQGAGSLELTSTVEPTKVSLSVKITESSREPDRRLLRHLARFALESVADDILGYCVSLDTSDDPVMTDCNAFVKKVGTHFGVAIPDLDADGIVDSFGGAPFTKTTMDPATAMSWAKDGLVVAGMKKAELNPKYGSKYDHGHLAIVHSTEDPSHPGYPMASWGSLGGRGKSNTSIRQSFPAAACNDDAVHFAFAPTS